MNLGRQGKHSSYAANSGCDFCIWFIYLGNPAQPIFPITGVDTGRYASELTCTYNGKDARKRKLCPKVMAKAKERFVQDAANVGQTPFQYVNTPSCDKTGEHFGTRYLIDIEL